MTRFGYAATAVLSVVAVAFTCGAAAADATKEDAARYEALRQRIQENERASRAAPSSPGRELPDTSGVEHILQPAGKGSFVEGGPKAPASPVDWAQTPASAALPAQRQAATPPSTATMPCPFGAPTKFASLLKVFPEVSWHVCVRDVGKKGLWIGPVEMRRTASGPWMTVIYEAGLADIFVPYEHINFRPYDMLYTQMLDKLQWQDAPNGMLVQLQNETPNTPTVMAETRERGIGWLCKGNSFPTRRAQEFVVWGITDGGNYDNIIEYGFRDDGTITFRVGNTGYNSPGNPHEPHVHIALWRVDMDLNGWPGDTAYWLRHEEPAQHLPLVAAQETQTPLDVESQMRWDEHEFSALLIENSTTNIYGHRIGYALSPLQTGLSRSFGPNELWTQNDVYVTAYSANEMGWMQQIVTPDSYLLPTLNSQSVTNHDLAVWIKTSALHVPGDEDKSYADFGNQNTTGITMTHWSGFKAEPHNLFNANPLGGPSRCGP